MPAAAANLQPVIEAPFQGDPEAIDAAGQIAMQQEIQTDAEVDWEIERIRSEEALQGQLARISEHIPEAETESESIIRGGRQLIEAYRVSPDFFDDDNRSAIFISLALSASKVEDSIASGHGDRAAIERKQAFVASAAFLLTRKYSGAFVDLVADHQRQAQEGHEEVSKATMDRFEQPELTHSLRRFIDKDGILDELRAKFQGVGGDEPDYHVLSIGKLPTFGKSNSSQNFDLAANGVSREEAAEWDRGLEERARQFTQLIPKGELVVNAAGFAIEFEDARGEHHVYIPGPAAELMMAEDRGIVPNGFMQQLMAKRTRGTVRHEFVHTRDGLIVEEEFGSSIEERRAEYFAGDPGEYFEVKEFFTQLRVLHGHSIADIFEESLASSHSDDPVSVYELVGKYYGLETMAEIAAAQPNAYVKHVKSSYTKEMLETNGGYEAIIARDSESGYVDKAAARERLKFVVNLLRRNNLKDGGINPAQEEFISNYLRPLFRSLSVSLAEIPLAA